MRAHAGRSITKLLCKIAINVAPIVRLRLVDSHISTYLIRLLVLFPPCSHALFRASHCAGRERKEEKKKEEKRREKSDEREKKKKRKEYQHFPRFYRRTLHVPFPWESWNVLRTRQYRYLQLVSILNCVMARLWTFARCIAHVYRFSRGNFFFFFFFFFIIHVTIIMRLFSPRFRFEFNPRVDGSISFRGRRHN